MNTIKFLQSFESEHLQLTPHSKLTKLRTELFSKGICWTDSIQGQFDAYDCFQVVLFLKKNTTGIDFDNPIVTECNGLVLEYVNRSWQVLVVPTANCTKTKISMNQANKYFQAKKYKVYEVLDATIINLYFHHGVWKISTSKGYDVTHFQFTGMHTYVQMFQQLIDLKYHKFNIEQLDINHCYTFAMRVSTFHSFNENKHIPLAKPNSNNYIKLIKMTNLQTLNNVDLEHSNISIPIYYPVEIKNANSISVLMNYAKHAYTKYAKGFETNNFKFKPLYGYVLRSDSSSVPRAYRNIMITSSLFALIKHGLYNMPMQSINEQITKMFIDKKRYEQYKILFDHHQDMFKQIEYVTQLLSQEVASLITIPQYSITNQILYSYGNKIARQFWAATGEQNSQAWKGDIQSLVYDFIRDEQYYEDLCLLSTAF